MKLFTLTLVSSILMLNSSVFANDGLLNQLRDLRQKQESEEQVVRVIQPVQQQSKPKCSSVQMARQRMRDLEGDGKKVGNVTLDSGHENVSIEGNNGEIDNSVNVTVVNPDEERCL